MEKEKIQEISFGIILCCGEASNYINEAFKMIKNYEFDQANKCLVKANDSLVEAHSKQSSLLQQFAEGNEVEVEIILVHAQDHLMSSMNYKNFVEEFFAVYKKLKMIEEKISYSVDSGA